LISMFLPLSGFDRIICFVGLAVFMGLTAYDTQKIKQLHAAFEGDYEMSKKASIFAALQLYLDFINIFLYILRLLGRRSSSN
ncbi:MAG: Bax inhibitor-1 family protein, partial [Ruthenibacterium lactatiformans]